MRKYFKLYTYFQIKQPGLILFSHCIKKYNRSHLHKLLVVRISRSCKSNNWKQNTKHKVIFVVDWNQTLNLINFRFTNVIHLNDRELYQTKYNSRASTSHSSNLNIINLVIWHSVYGDLYCSTLTAVNRFFYLWKRRSTWKCVT